MNAKHAILDRLASALGRPVTEGNTEPVSSSDIPRDYRVTAETGEAERIELLTDRLIDYDAGVYEVPAEQVPDKVAELLGDAASIVAPHDLDSGWAEKTSAKVLEDSADKPLSIDELDSVDAVVTGATVAIADTGTICLSGERTGRRAITLVPDHHIIVLKKKDICTIVPEGVAVLEERGLTTSPQTWVSGPSASVDIEFQRVAGVHGPRTLDVIITD